MLNSKKNNFVPANAFMPDILINKYDFKPLKPAQSDTEMWH